MNDRDGALATGDRVAARRYRHEDLFDYACQVLTRLGVPPGVSLNDSVVAELGALGAELDIAFPSTSTWNPGSREA